MSNWIANLKEQMKEFCDKEEAIIEKDSQRAVITADVQRFDVFYQQVKRRRAYPYIRVVVDGWEGLLKFQSRDGMPINLQYEYYWDITRDIMKILNHLTDATRDNIEAIESYKRGLV